MQKCEESSVEKEEEEKDKNKSLVIQNFNTSMDGKEGRDDSPFTPKVIQHKKVVELRQHRRINSKMSFNQRSSSIHSTRSNRSTATSKKMKKKSSTGKRLRVMRVDQRKGNDALNSSDSFTSATNSPRSAEFMKAFKMKSKNSYECDPRLGKLSSFAKIKSNRKKKPKIK